MGVLETVLADFRYEAMYTLNCCWPIAAHTKTTNHTKVRFGVINQANVLIFGMWDETRVSEENRCSYGENIQIPHMWPGPGIEPRTYAL